MKVTIDVPSSLADITLEQYQTLMSLQDEKDSEDYAARKMIACLCKIPLSDVLKIQYTSIIELLEKFNAIFREDKFLIQRFELGGVEFGFVPELESISFGEYIDAEKYLSEWSTMNNAMAVLYRPVVKRKDDKYTIEDYETSATYAEVMKAMPLSVALGAQLFFWNLKRDLLLATMDYLAEEMKEIPQETIAQHLSLPKDGGGINQYINSLKVMLDDLTKLPLYRSINA